MPVNMDAEHGRAMLRPISGPYKSFAHELRRLFGYNGECEFITARMASDRTGINRTTIADGLRGKRMGETSIFKLAQMLNTDPLPLLRMSGYAPETFGRVAERAEDNPQDDDESELLSVFRALPQTRQTLLLSVARTFQAHDDEEDAGETISILEDLREAGLE